MRLFKGFIRERCKYLYCRLIQLRHHSKQGEKFLAEVRGYSWVTGLTHTVTHKFCEKQQELNINKTFIEAAAETT